jgi:hypothetical protein
MIEHAMEHRFAAKECATVDLGANGRKGVPMQRMCSVIARAGVVLLPVILFGPSPGVHGDLIRSKPARSYPDIAGDIVGTQTYTYDPITQTGTFELVNAPHLIALGPTVKELIQMLPDRDGTISQSLQMKLDRHGRLVASPENKFQIRGTVVIGEKTYQGLLLEGKPTAFGADIQATRQAKNPEVFDLNMTITGGELADAFGSEAYLRIVPQSKSTFEGSFTTDFSSEKPLTNLRAARRQYPTPVPEPTAFFTLLTCGAGLLACRLRRQLSRRTRSRRDINRTLRPSRAIADTATYVAH